MLDLDQHALYQSIGTRIRAIREHRGLTREALAAALGLTSHASIYPMESGRQQMLLHRLYEIAEVLQVDIWDLCPGLNPGIADGPWYLNTDAWDPAVMVIRGS